MNLEDPKTTEDLLLLGRFAEVRQILAALEVLKSRHDDLFDKFNRFVNATDDGDKYVLLKSIAQNVAMASILKRHFEKSPRIFHKGLFLSMFLSWHYRRLRIIEYFRNRKLDKQHEAQRRTAQGGKRPFLRVEK